ncbi:hypothetical protein BDV96DRAFT_552325 [Lophiotrema nucula]|uniref:Uncharacterized protein n=1 Tax=Lophiotrema nucula TaxID=690887 RepID=A0A6A5YX84_9PLEO|nr:hypothetical protein BDV96DRAFT_552325 [Lophiotrema nucula]
MPFNASSSEPIAIVGSACRFPGDSSSPSKLWDLLTNPSDVLSRIPNDRFNATGHYHPDGLHHGTSNVQDSYFLNNNIRQFDAQFFGIKAVEARTMDPQQRMLLEVVYEGLERAGMPIEDLGGSQTGVFVGLMCEDWEAHLRRDEDKIPVYTATGTARSIMSNRISYFFNWRGPSMTIDTACSSSLVAVHLAIQSLRSGEAPIAIAAGANLILTPDLYVAESKLKMLSPGSRSRMWDVDADGYARGEGVAALVLKPLSSAIRDGDAIECVIRETAINQDGRTLQGITMPSARAQAELIRTTYAKAGLDLSDEKNRCQYFEAHGTGTPAGDPQEAEAIAEAFFGNNDSAASDYPLYVGSIKTVIGHTEGTAGIAGLMKASLAVQHGVVPPNLLFNKLNPALEPFYIHLEVPTRPLQWPDLAPNQLRRASVNSFGFGGTNAHAIIEQYKVPASEKHTAATACCRPFVFSAASQSTLACLLEESIAFLEKDDSISLRDLSYTLLARRTHLPCKTSVAAASVSELVAALKTKIASASKDNEIGLRIQSKPSPSILGVFTGQGSQWTSMGRELIIQIESVRKCLERLDVSLATLPSNDRPSWSIVTRLLETEDAVARLGDAAFSQPLCTAIQIALVDILRECGVSFKAVVGHSSGEIGAAYAAGFISAEDAIRIAYYRGLYAKLAGDGKSGAMIAVGTSLEDAKELCEFPEFQGRLSVAACNSPSSITLSGDADAIDEVKFVLDDEKKFARRLRVDTAYHSHHMNSCSETYIKALEACKIQVLPGNPECDWYSSVMAGDVMNAGEHLKASYWNENMLNPVLFAQAISAAVSDEVAIDFALEVGPHPALQGPALQTIQNVLGDSVPYSGLLKRGSDDFKALIEGLSFVWLYGGKYSVDFASLDQLIDSGGTDPPRILSNLPSYPWDHTKSYWFETRMSKNLMSRCEPCHDLLGNFQTHTADEYRWKNDIHIRNIPWVTGHQLQGQTVMPAAAYVSTAIEAALAIANGRSIELIEIEDMTISRALTLNEGDEFGVETLFTVNLDQKSRDGEVLAEFKYHSASSDESDVLALNASGMLRIVYGDAAPTTLPQRGVTAPNMVDVDEDLFYSNLASIGYQYREEFRALSSLMRAQGHGQGVVASTLIEDGATSLLIHPAMLDAAIQSILLAFCWPGDGSLRELHVPVGIRRIRINPFFNLSGSSSTSTRYFPFDSVMSERTISGFDGDVDIFPEGGHNAAIQLEGLTVKPFAPPTAASDRHVFSTWKWSVMDPDCALAVGDNRATEHDKLVATITEQACVYYLRELKATITSEEWANGQWHHQKLLDFANHVLNGVADGTQPFSKNTWLATSREELYDHLMPQIGDCVEMRLVRTVGEHLADAVRGKTNILEHMLEDNLLNDFYTEGRGVYEHTDFLANVVDQLVHRYGNMDILEIGAGTGGFFEKATQVFTSHSSKMVFRALDCEKDIEAQGYTKHSYDLIVASLVLHATENLESTLKHVRDLLKPGGWLVMLELTPSGPMRLGFCMSGLPGWWLGWKDGRELSPCAAPERWHDALQKSGFSGVDSVTPEVDVFERPCFVIAAQALDERLDYLRNPLQSSFPAHPQQVAILGGKNLMAVRLADRVARLLTSCGMPVVRAPTLDKSSLEALPAISAVISLIDLDQPIFQDVSDNKLSALKQLFEKSKTVLWVTRGRVAKDPYMNMVLGFAATLRLEMPLLRTQFLELDHTKTLDAQLVAEMLLSLNGFDQFQSAHENEPLLWSSEPEIVQNHDVLMIPRLRHVDDANARHNSVKRAITSTASPDTDTIDLVWIENRYAVQKASQLSRMDAKSKNNIELRVSHSTLLAIRTSSTAHHYVMIGKNASSGESFLALAEHNSSTVQIPEERSLKIQAHPTAYPTLVQAAAHDLLATDILSRCGGRLLLHEPDANFAAVLESRAALAGVAVTFSTTKSTEGPATWLKVHPRSTRRMLRASLPKHVTCFINWASERTDISQMIEDNFPSACLQLQLSDLLVRNWTKPLLHVPETTDSLLQTVASRILNDLSSQEVPRISLAEIAGGAVASSELTVLDWTSSDNVNVKVQPLNSSAIFASDRTYILFGLTSDLAQSLCMWMIAHGARFIVMTSRNPRIAPEWMRRAEATGASVKIYANDITNESAVRSLCDDIFATLPPVAGIANGAMVLVDTMITEMTTDAWHRVTKPKVNGSIYLERIFAERPLEFFIFFSSIAAVYGNEGQSNYGAANMYMTSLAYQRRQRGQAASVIHIGPITGAGYVTREAGDNVLSWVVNHGHCLLSQNDFFAGFAEAILAGRPDCGQSPELVLDERFQPGRDMAREDPRFQFTLPRVEKEDRSNGIVAATSVKAGLANATTAQKVLEVVKSGFFAKLQILLQDDSTEGNDEEVLDRAANELGIDSLIAVDLRAWFLKELDVDMPVLKILGGASIRDMLDFSVEKLPKPLIPNISGDVVDLKASLESPSVLSVKKNGMDETIQVAKGGLDSSSASGSFSLMNTDTPSSGVIDISDEISSAPSDDVDSNSASEGPQIVRTFDLSFGQSRFWTLMSLLEDTTALNIACLVRLTGSMRVNDLDRAVRTVGERHEALRTCFYTDDTGTAKQGILGYPTLALEQQSLNESEVKVEFKKMRHYQFDLARGHVVRVILSSQSATSHYLIIAYHHIAMDGVSLEVFLSDLQKAYNRQSLSPKVFQYPDFSERQRAEVRNGKASQDIAFWKQRFQTIPAPLPLLPFASKGTRDVLNQYDINSVEFRVDGSFTTRIKLACKKHKVTPFHFYLATYQALLLRVLKVEDVCIGMADANRLDSDVQKSIGNYLNLLPIRLATSLSASFADVMQLARTRTYAALGHSKVPFDVLLEELHIERSVLHSPLFQAFINYRQGVQEKRSFGDAKAEAQEYLIAKTAYDFSLDIVDNPGGQALISFMVQKSLYSELDARTLMDCYARLLDAFSKNPKALLATPSLYSPEDLEHALALGRGPSTDLSLTGDIKIAVFQEPTVDWVCSMLAIMRVGAAYVPFDPRLSMARLRVVAKECSPAAVLVHDSTASEVLNLDLGAPTVVNISSVPQETTEPVENAARPNLPAVVLFTSGSTGIPKGITLRHVGLANELSDSAEKFALGPKDKVLQQGALSFDISLWQTFNALANGGMLYIIAKEHRIDPVIISQHIATEGITVTCATPSEYLCWLRYGATDSLRSSKWRLAISGGEQVTRTHLEAFNVFEKSGLRLFNAYGPSEVSILSSKMELPYTTQGQVQSDSPGRYPVGYTTRNCSVYIVDEEQQLLPVGYAGEICISGPGVAAGYLGNDALTREKFVPDNFASLQQISKGFVTMYKTGDRGRFRADGALMVEGRLEGDTEIKLRGIRIDLQEVEKAILKTSNGAVLDVVVSVQGNPEILVAHLVYRSNVTAAQTNVLWAKIATSLPLPMYMRPSVAVPVAALPLTDHGKVDRQAVAKMTIDHAISNCVTEHNAQLSPNQIVLRNLWAEVVSTTPAEIINSTSDFFLVGGNSGLLVRLQRAIRNTFSVVIPLIQLFECSTLDAMCALIDSFSAQENVDWKVETAVDRDGVLERVKNITHGQRRNKKSQTGLAVLLTGANGNIGSAVLRHLVKDSRVEKVHCVAVRGSQADFLAELDLDEMSATKLSIHHGDLTLPLLGLPTQVFASLATDVDSIIHCGAQRSFWDYYHTLRGVNVGSVRELVLLAAAAQTLGANVPIHFASSGNVQDLLVSDSQPTTDGREGYVASKWAAEQILNNAAGKLGLRVVLHRMGSNSKPAETEETMEADLILKEKVLADFIRYSQRLRAVPQDADVQSWSGTMGFAPLNDVAERFVSAAISTDPANGQAGVEMLHYSARVRLSTSAIDAHVKQNTAGMKEVKEFVRIPAIEWVGRAKKQGWNWVFVGLDLVKGSAGTAERELILRR